jgi:hypothetical protein
MFRRIQIGWFAAVLLISSGTMARADFVTTVTLDTSALQSNASSNGPYTIDFQLNDGSFTGVANNTATISNVTFGGGSLTGSSPPLNVPAPVPGSDSTGDLSSTLTIQDGNGANGGFNEFQQSFNAGSSLSFKLDLTANTDSPSPPDEFTFSIFDKNGTQLANGPNYAFLTADIYATGPSITLAGGSVNGTSFAAPTDSNPVPEPSTLILLLSGAVCAGAAAVRKRRGVWKNLAAGLFVNRSEGGRVAHAKPAWFKSG